MTLVVVLWHSIVCTVCGRIGAFRHQNSFRTSLSAHPYCTIHVRKMCLTCHVEFAKCPIDAKKTSAQRWTVCQKKKGKCISHETSQQSERKDKSHVFFHVDVSFSCMKFIVFSEMLKTIHDESVLCPAMELRLPKERRYLTFCKRLVTTH